MAKPVCLTLWGTLIFGSAGILCVANASDGIDLLERLKSRSAEQSWREMRDEHKTERKDAKLQRKASRAGQPLPESIRNAGSETQTELPQQTPTAFESPLPAPEKLTPVTPVSVKKDAPVEPAVLPVLVPKVGEGSQVPEPLFGVEPQITVQAPAVEPTPQLPVVAQPEAPDDYENFLKHEAELDAFIEQMRRRRESRYNTNEQVGSTIFGEVFQLDQSDTTPQLQATPVVQQAPAKPYVEQDIEALRKGNETLPENDSPLQSGLERGKQARELKPIGQIMPFSDYEPDPELAAKDPCRNLCPRPDDLPCETADGQYPACPEVKPIGEELFSERAFAYTDFNWCAPNFSYNPLYFEDADLERSQNSRNMFLQPVASVSRYSLQLVSLPYQWVLHPVHEEIYPLGHMRPGEYKPGQIDPIPLNAKAAAAAAGFYTGFFYVFP